MSDWQFPVEPSGGGLMAMLVLAGALGSALNVPIKWLCSYLGWRKTEAEKAEDEREQDLNELVDRKVHTAVESAMSPVRQHIAEVHRGLDGKQISLESRLADLVISTRDRDEALSNLVHTRMTQEFREHRKELKADMAEAVAALRQHMTDLVRAATNGRIRNS